LKCDGTRAETRFRLSAKRTSPFKSAGASVQSTAGSRGVCISGSNAGYTKFRGSVKSEPATFRLVARCINQLRHPKPPHLMCTTENLQQYYRRQHSFSNRIHTFPPTACDPLHITYRRAHIPAFTRRRKLRQFRLGRRTASTIKHTLWTSQ